MNIKIDITLCRVCLKQGPGTNIYTGNILEKFLFTTLVQVEKNDGLSEIICKKCLARLQIAYDFKKDAIDANSNLRSFISNVNKQFQQVTASNSGTGKVKKRIRKEAGSESYDDELEEDMQALIDDEQETVEYKDVDTDLSDDAKKSIDSRHQLVEILGDNSAITIRKTRSMRAVNVQEETNDEPPENMEVFLVDEASEVETGYMVDDYDTNAGELITDETDEPQYLDDEHDELYEADESKPKANQRSGRGSGGGGINLENHCEICNKSFSTRTNLTRHKITHEGRKPYVCAICGNSFTQNGSLKSHMFIHTGERPYQCKQCGKAFTQSKSLVFHMRRHTGEKPFDCEHCGVKFRQKDGLKRHVAAKHSSDRQKHHVCDICGKVLLSKYSLNMHLSRHSEHELIESGRTIDKRGKLSHIDDISVKNEDDKLPASETADEWKLYACEFCDQAFTNSNDLVEHTETHTEVHDQVNYIEDSS